MRNEPGGQTERGVGSLANALRLVEVMAGEPASGISELARELGVSKATVDRLLGTLVRAGYAERDADTRKYRLTVKIVALAERVRSRIGLVEIARPRLRALAADLGEAANLGVVRGQDLVYLETVPSSHVFQIEARPGVSLAAYSTGAGKAILAFSRPDIVDAYLRGVRPVAYTPSTLTSVEDIRRELDAVRAAGVAEDRGELLEEAWCLAAPIPGPDGWAAAAVSVTAPRSRYAVKREDIESAVRATACDVAAALAGVAPPR
jgi:DNA-binding IclR family transcriptional regulator